MSEVVGVIEFYGKRTNLRGVDGIAMCLNIIVMHCSNS